MMTSTDSSRDPPPLPPHVRPCATDATAADKALGAGNGCCIGEGRQGKESSLILNPTIGALVIRIGFGGHYTITIVRNAQNSIGGNKLGPYIIELSSLMHRCSQRRSCELELEIVAASAPGSVALEDPSPERAQYTP